MDRPDTITLMLCVNHWRNGVFTGRCRELSIHTPDRPSRGDCALTLESPWADRSLRCRIGDHCLTLGRRHTWPHLGHTEWVGNWCWDAVTLRPRDAVQAVNFVLRMGYRPTVGLADVWYRVERAGKLRVADLLRGVEGKAR